MKNLLNRPRLWCAALGALALAAVAIAVVLQLAFDWRPCPWCILQRYAYLLLGCVLLARAWAPGPGKLATSLRWASALVAATGAGLAIRQLHIILEAAPTCGRDALSAAINALPTAQYLPTVFEATGNCIDKVPLNFPLMSLIGFVVIGGIAVAVRPK